MHGMEPRNETTNAWGLDSPQLQGAATAQYATITAIENQSAAVYSLSTSSRS